VLGERGGHVLDAAPPDEGDDEVDAVGRADLGDELGAPPRPSTAASSSEDRIRGYVG